MVDIKWPRFYTYVSFSMTITLLMFEMQDTHDANCACGYNLVSLR